MNKRKGCRNHRPYRRMQLECFESRRVMVAEGSPFNLNQSYDISGLGGTLSATVEWGDGNTTAANVGPSPTLGPIRFRFDYSHDTTGFFSANERRVLLQQLADTITTKFSDSLSAIVPGNGSAWTASYRHPTTGNITSQQNLTIAANEILVYAGARSFGGTGERAWAYRGAFSLTTTSQAFADNVRARGQTGALSTPASDFGPWGGSISFDTGTNWFFGSATTGLDNGEFDFATIASHELFHILGFGTTASFDNKVTPSGFVGANTVAIAGVSPVPLGDSDHFASSLSNSGQQTLMSASVDSGQRKLATRLDLAALQDIGWQLIAPNLAVNASKVYGDDGTYPIQVRLRGSIYGEKTYSQSEIVTNVAPLIASIGNQTGIEGQLLSLPSFGAFTDPGFGTPLTIPPRTELFTYAVDWGDGTSLSTGNAAVVSVGSPGVPTRGQIAVSHTFARAGTYNASLTIVDDNGGTHRQGFVINIAPPPQLALSVNRNAFDENVGAEAAQLTIRRTGFDNAIPLIVSLASSDTTEATVPASVTIPAGADSVSVFVRAIDDTLLDGVVAVSLRGSVGTLLSNPISVDVRDSERITLTATRLTFGENEGAGVSVITVTRSNTDTLEPITVQLSSSDASELVLPATVIIPAGQSSTTVGVTAVDDSLMDGSQSVRVTASEIRYVSGTIDFLVTDYQPISIALESTALSEEDPSRRSTTARLEIRSPAPAGGVTIQLTSEPTSQLTIPASVFIPAGQRQVAFSVQAIDDFIPQGNRTVRILGQGPGLIATSVDIAMSDTDIAYWTNPANPMDVDGEFGVEPLDVLTIVNEIRRGGLRALNPNLDLDLPFVDTNRNGLLDPLDVLGVINYINSRR